MIYRLKHGNTCLDFGSQQAAYQLLDNYPPHLRDGAAVQEITSQEIKDKLSELGLEAQKRAPSDPESGGSQHYQWLLSRMEFYTGALGPVESQEAIIRQKVANLPTVS